MKTTTYKFDGGHIEYRVPIYTDLLKIYSKLDPSKLSLLKDDKASQSVQLEAIADCLDAIHPLIVDIKFKNYESMDECFQDMELMQPMTEIFKDIMALISQSGKKTKRRKK